MYAGREVFPDAPLEYVAAELRYPYAPRLRQDSVRDAVFGDLESRFPILRSMPQVTMTATLGGPVSQQVEQVTRAFDRRSRASLTVNANAMTIETTAYQEFGDLRELVQECFAALDRHASPAAIERLGMRYVNELRVPVAITDVRDWHGWVSDSLTGAAAIIPDRKSTALQGILQYEMGGDQGLILRFAALPAGGLIGNEPLTRRHPAGDGPYFALDLDSFWQPPLGASPEWSVDRVMDALDQLHDPVGTAFQGAITDKLRDEVLRRNDGN